MSVSHEAFPKTQKEDFQNERFPSCPKHWDGRLPKRAFSTRLSQNLRMKPSNTSVFHETFAKTSVFHEALPKTETEDERFPRDFPKNWHGRLPKRAFSTRLSQKLRRKPSKRSVFHETVPKTETEEFQNERFPQGFPFHEAFPLQNERFCRRLFKNCKILHAYRARYYEHAWAMCETKLRSIRKSQLYLHPAQNMTISADGRARTAGNAISRAFRTFDAQDLRRGLRGQPPKTHFACIPHLRHALSPQRVEFPIDAVCLTIRL